MVNAPLFTTLSQMPAGSRTPFRVTASETWYYGFDVAFQYFSIAPMRGLGLRDGLVTAVRIDTLSLLAYEVGMLFVMGLRARAYPDLQPSDRGYWLLMQVAMLAGFATTCPINWWLIRQGVKERM